MEDGRLAVPPSTCGAQVTTMPEGLAPLGPAAEVSGVSVPPLTEKPVTASVPDSTTQSVEPSGERRASSAPAPISPDAVS